jgi:hypothetical protein
MKNVGATRWKPLQHVTSIVPFSVRSMLVDLRPRQLRRSWIVSSQLQPSPNLRCTQRIMARLFNSFTRQNSEGTGVWAISIVRNESDIIGFTVEHLLREGVDHVVVADNLSKDGTNDILAGLARTLPLTVVPDGLDAHYQGTKMTLLARWAWSQGAEWIVPFDADELWYSTSGTLRDTLASTTCDVALAEMWGHVPHPTDDDDELNPYIRVRGKAETKLRTTKLAFRSHKWARIYDGNHSVHRTGTRQVLLAIRHFPFRSREQMLRKLREGGRALDATDLPEGTGHNWRKLSKLSDEEILSEMSESATGLTHPDPRDVLLDDPAPFRSTTRPGQK